jgi:hypothetical protein
MIPPWPEPGVVLSRVKSRVLARLAPERGLRVAAVPPLRGGLDPACARLPMAWQVGTKEPVLLIEPRNMDQQGNALAE